MAHTFYEAAGLGQEHGEQCLLHALAYTQASCEQTLLIPVDAYTKEAPLVMLSLDSVKWGWVGCGGVLSPSLGYRGPIWGRGG